MPSYSFSTVLWIYIAMLLVGGMMGFIKAKSKISLISSLAFAVLLALCALDIIRENLIAKILIGLLIVVFSLRFLKTRKFMPSGLMVLISLVTLFLLLNSN
jgi:uncharacterized membrane protein (UPF0136 family)